ncbi:unnamed protein product [Ixodes persulcatus]
MWRTCPRRYVLSSKPSVCPLVFQLLLQDEFKSLHVFPRVRNIYVWENSVTRLPHQTGALREKSSFELFPLLSPSSSLCPKPV